MTLPDHMDWELRLLGVVPAKAETVTREKPKGIWYRDGDIPH